MRDHLEINRILLSKRFQEFDTHGSIYLWKKKLRNECVRIFIYCLSTTNIICYISFFTCTFFVDFNYTSKEK